MRRLVMSLLVVCALAAPLIAQVVSAQEETFLQVVDDPNHGAILTDAEGMTLYLFTPDETPGESTCYDDCAANWPPVPADETMMLPPGIQGTLTEIEREDGTTQLAYNDIPLYYFVADQAPGDVNGQGVGEVWYIVPPGMVHGDPPHTASAAMATPGAEMATPESD